MLFHPGHPENKKSVLVKEICLGLSVVLFLAAALLSTVGTI